MMRLLAILAFLSLLGSIPGYFMAMRSSEDGAKKESVYERVKRTGVIRCGYWIFPPVVTKDANTGKLQGPAPVLFEDLASRLQLKVEWVEEVNFANMTQGLASHRYDAVCTGSWLTARVSREAIFTSHYLYSALLPMVRADDTRFDASLESLNSEGVTIAVQDDALQEVAKSDFPKAKLHSVSSVLPTSQLYEDVAAKKADMVLADAGDILHYQEKHPGVLKLIHADKPVRLYPWVIPVAPGEHDLVSMLDGALQEMVLSKRIQKIVAEHGIPTGTYEYVKPSTTH